MTNEELEVMANLITEIQDLRRHQDELYKERSQMQDTCNEVSQLRERLDIATKTNEDLKKQCSDLSLDRDNLRLKLGEWARFINFNVYERLNKFVVNGKITKEKCDSLTAFFEQICRSLEMFQKMHPVTFIEGGMAK